MTNYEWLVKSGKLADLMREIIEEEDLENVLEKWSIPDIKRLHSDNISDWLQAERKTKQYVLLDDVLEIINTPLKIIYTKKKYDLDDVMNMSAEYYADVMNRMRELEVKEIDE